MEVVIWYLYTFCQNNPYFSRNSKNIRNKVCKNKDYARSLANIAFPFRQFHLYWWAHEQCGKVVTKTFYDWISFSTAYLHWWSHGQCDSIIAITWLIKSLSSVINLTTIIAKTHNFSRYHTENKWPFAVNKETLNTTIKYQTHCVHPKKHF